MVFKKKSVRKSKNPYIFEKIRSCTDKSIRVGTLPLLMLEVEKRECHTESKQGPLCLHWKSRGRNVILSPICTEIKSCAGTTLIQKTFYFLVSENVSYLFKPTSVCTM